MIPRHPEEVTAGWLATALPGHVTIADVEVVTIRDATNCNAILRVDHDAVDVPDTLFLKLPPLDPDRRARLDWASMARREMRFYRDLAPRVDVRVPRAHVTAVDEKTGDFLLLMDELTSAGHLLPDPDAGLDPELARVALNSFAELHVRYEDGRRRHTDAAWLTPDCSG